MNPTHNGLTNNDENLIEIVAQDAVVDALTHVDALIARSELITSGFLNECVRSQHERKRSKSASAHRR